MKISNLKNNRKYEKNFYFDNIARFLEFSISTKNLLTEKSLYEFEKYNYSYLNNFDKIMSEHYCKQTKEITDIINSKKNLKILEVGCGCGTESLWFSINNAKVTGIDLRKERLEVALERKINFEKQFGVQLDIKFIFSDLFDFVENNKNEFFDIIFMEQAYHHIEPRNKLIPALKKLLKKEGYIIISEANALNPLIQIGLLKLRGFKTVKKFIDADGKERMYGNERIIRKSSLIRSFEKEGFLNLSSKYFRVLPNKIYLRSFTFLENLSSKLFPFIFTHYNVVFKKKI